MVTTHEFTHGRSPHILMLHPSKQVVQNPLSQGHIGNVNLVQAQLAKYRRHNGDTASDDRGAVIAQATQGQPA